MRKPSNVTVAKTVAYSIAAIAAISSYGHQVHLLELANMPPLFGAIPSAWVTPVTVDALAFIGLMIRNSDTVSSATKKAAMLPLILAGGMSVAANVATAVNLIQVVVGIWTVAAYMIAEVFVARLKPKTAVEKVTKADVGQVLAEAERVTREAVATPVASAPANPERPVARPASRTRRPVVASLSAARELAGTKVQAAMEFLAANPAATDDEVTEATGAKPRTIRRAKLNLREMASGQLVTAV